MFELFLVAHLWDFTHEDVGSVLDRLHGDVGVTGISLWVAAPGTVQLRANHLNPRVFRTRGGVFFQPTDRSFSSTRCQPIVSSWVTMGNPLASISRACAGSGLRLRAIVSAGATGRMAERYPEFACRNVLGDESRTRLCLSNAEAQSFLRAMVLDLSTNFGVRALTLTDFNIRWSDADDVSTATPIGPVERSLLAICFCDSCVYQSHDAGIDVEAARSQVGRAVNEALEHGPGEWTRVEDFVGNHESLAEHCRRQVETLNSLLRRLRETCGGDLLLVRDGNAVQAGAANGLDVSIPSAVVTRVADPVDLSAKIPPQAKRNELQLSAISIIGPAGSQLVSILPEAAKAGFAAVEVDHYGVLSETALTTLKQAIRFARRSAAE